MYCLYDLNDTIVCLYEDLLEIYTKLGYPPKEINRKFKKTMTNFIVLYLEKKSYKLYKI